MTTQMVAAVMFAAAGLALINAFLLRWKLDIASGFLYIVTGALFLAYGETKVAGQIGIAFLLMGMLLISVGFLMKSFGVNSWTDLKGLMKK